MTVGELISLLELVDSDIEVRNSDGKEYVGLYVGWDEKNVPYVSDKAYAELKIK